MINKLGLMIFTLKNKVDIFIQQLDFKKSPKFSNITNFTDFPVFYLDF